MNTTPICRCGNPMTSEKSTITTVNGDTVSNGAPRSGTTTIKNGSIYVCKPCIEKSDNEWEEKFLKEMENSVENKTK